MGLLEVGFGDAFFSLIFFLGRKAAALLEVCFTAVFPFLEVLLLFVAWAPLFRRFFFVQLF
jgi:hypothetical protein